MSKVLIHSAPGARSVARVVQRRMLFPYLLVAPSIVLLLALTVFPLFFALKNSFYFWNLQMSPQPLGFIGFGNYDMALSTSLFIASLANTIILTFSGTALGRSPNETCDAPPGRGSSPPQKRP